MSPQIEGNKLIAEFAEGIKYSVRLGAWLMDGQKNPIASVDLQYHSSWDWLMPVVERIESMPSNLERDTKYIVAIQGGFCCVSEDGDGDMLHTQDWESPKIQVVWETVVKFITWYNNNKGEQPLPTPPIVSPKNNSNEK